MINKMSNSSMSSKQWYRSMLAGNDAFAPSAYELIETTVLGSDTASVTFSSIVSTYKHLQIRYTARSSYTSNPIDFTVMRLNGATTGYFWHYLSGNGSAVSSAGDYGSTSMLIDALPANSNTANAFAGGVIDILDYADTSKNKTFRALTGFHGSSSPWIGLESGSRASTSAVTSVTLLLSSGNFKTGSRFSLYGIKGE